MQIRKSQFIVVAIVSLCAFQAEASNIPTAPSDQTRPTISDLLRSYPTTQTKVQNPPGKERIIHFPINRSFGRLMIDDENPEPLLSPFGYPFETAKWDDFARAQGDVKVPPGRRACLILDSWTWEKPENLSALKELEPDDIYSLTISHKWSPGKRPDDRCMPYVVHLTGLNTLNLDEANITEKGLEYLTQIKSLERLCLPAGSADSHLLVVGKLKSLKVLYFIGDNRVTNDGLMHLSNLKSLEHLTLRSVRVTDEGLKHLSVLPSLRHLILGGNFTNNAFLYLQDVPSLKTLSIGIMEIGGGPQDPLIKRFNGQGMKNVARLKQLENFSAQWMEGITDNGVAYLKAMPSLKRLDIGSANISDDAMLDLKEIKTLEYLHLPNYGLTDEGLKHIAGLQNLKYLWVGGRSDSSLADQSLHYIGLLRKLQTLCIGGTGFTDDGIKHIANLPNIRTLSLFHAGELTNKGLANLAPLKTLRELNITCPRVTIAGLANLNPLSDLETLVVHEIAQDNSTLNIAGLTNLQKLTLSLKATRKGNEIVRDPVHDEDIICLTKLTRLRDLQGLIGISDIGAKHVSTLTNLERLGLGGPGLTGVGLTYLANLKKLRRLSIVDGGITDDDLRHLEVLPRLEDIALIDCPITDAGLSRLKEKMPHVRVTAFSTPQRVNVKPPARLQNRPQMLYPNQTAPQRRQ